MPFVVEVALACEVARGGCLELGVCKEGADSSMCGAVDGNVCFGLRHIW